MSMTASEAWVDTAPAPRHATTALDRDLPVAVPPAPDPRSGGFEALCARCRPQMEAVAKGLTGNPHDAADLVQDALVRAYRSLDTFESGTNFQGWILHILRNLHINAYHKCEGREVVVSWEDLTERTGAHEPEALRDIRGEPEQVVLGNVPGDEVSAALAGLSADFRNVMELADVHGLSYPEIAQHLSVPIGTVRSRLSRARQQMRRQLTDYAVRHGYARREELEAAGAEDWELRPSPDTALSATTRSDVSRAEHSDRGSAGRAAGSHTPGRRRIPVAVTGDLGGQVLTPGVYQSAVPLSITANDLTLDARGDPRAVFVFQTASRLTVGPGRRVVLRGAAQAANIHWLVGSSALLEAGCAFKGNIVAADGIALRPGATLDGVASLEGATSHTGPQGSPRRGASLCADFAG